MAPLFLCMQKQNSFAWNFKEHSIGQFSRSQWDFYVGSCAWHTAKRSQELPRLNFPDFVEHRFYPLIALRSCRRTFRWIICWNEASGNPIIELVTVWSLAFVEAGQNYHGANSSIHWLDSRPTAEDHRCERKPDWLGLANLDCTVVGYFHDMWFVNSFVVCDFLWIFLSVRESLPHLLGSKYSKYASFAYGWRKQDTTHRAPQAA